MKKTISYVLIFILGFAACAFVLKTFGFEPASGSRTDVLRALSHTPTGTVVKKGQNPIADAAATVLPSVVSIDIAGEREVQNPLGMFGFPSQKQVVRGKGSGIIISDDGYILTNNHVVAEANDIKVTLSNGKKYPAKLIGRDSLTEVAVIKIDATNLPAARLGNSDDLRVGDWAIAVGNPLGQQNTVTVGVISAIGRDEQVSERTQLKNLIQTDAAINPGNSGGALTNIQGEVIGINTMIVSPNAQQGGIATNIGIGFAIPINSAKITAAELIKNGKISRPFLGVVVRDLTGDLGAWYQQHGFKGKGACIQNVAPGENPASRAGLVQGDVITDIEGEKVAGAADVPKIIQKHKVGQLIRITIWRDGKDLVIVAKLAEMPQELQ
jgi:S1-C subfamily serine protease